VTPIPDLITNTQAGIHGDSQRIATAIRRAEQRRVTLAGGAVYAGNVDAPRDMSSGALDTHGC
jgi:hypothetical protein